MVRLDYFIFGYYKVSVIEEKRVDFLNTALKNHLSFKMYSDGTFIIASYEKRRFYKLFSKDTFTISPIFGLPSVFIKNKNRYGLFVGIFISTLLFVYLSSLVWDIRIESDAQVDTAAIIDTLDTLGLYVGAPWSGIDTSSVENSLLLLSNDVGWVNVNRRGTVAYVEVRKKDIPDHQPNLTYSNIVAAYDGIIESINVKSGHAVVKVGDSVRAGDLLVSGVLPDSLGGGIVGAEATVIAKRQDVITSTVPSVFEQYEYSSPLLSSFSLKIFNFSVNILNFSGNFATECDIIEKTTPIFIFDKKIPIDILSTYAIQKRSISISSSPEEMTRIASERLNSKMLELLANSTLISIKTTGGFFGDEYTLTSYVTHTLDIAKEVAIELS